MKPTLHYEDLRGLLEPLAPDLRVIPQSRSSLHKLFQEAGEDMTDFVIRHALKAWSNSQPHYRARGVFGRWESPRYFLDPGSLVDERQVVDALQKEGLTLHLDVTRGHAWEQPKRGYYAVGYILEP